MQEGQPSQELFPYLFEPCDGKEGDTTRLEALHNGVFRGVRLVSDQRAATAKMKVVLQNAADWVEAVTHFFENRFIADEHPMLKTIAGCMDLRLFTRSTFKSRNQVISFSQYLNRKILPQLKKVHDWMKNVGFQVDSEVDVFAAAKCLYGRIHETVTTSTELARKWKKASGTVIQKDVLTQAALYEGCQPFLHMYQACALKINCEAVVEGMCSVVDKHAVGQRGCDIKRYAWESILDWNSPAPHLADDFLLESLSELGKRNKANALKFNSVDSRGADRLKTVVSAVIDKMRRRKSKFSFMN